MSTPVIVGVILAIMFLVAFSQWFINLLMGMNEVVLDDKFYHYRIIGSSVFVLFLFAGSFVGIATVMECPDETPKEGILASLQCEQYLKIKTAADSVFNPAKKAEDKSLEEPTTLPTIRSKSAPTPPPSMSPF